MVDVWALFASGNILGAITGVFTNPLGNWFYAIVLMLVVGTIYLKTNNTTISATVMLLLTIAMTALLPPEVLIMVYIMTVLVVMVVLFRLWNRA